MTPDEADDRIMLSRQTLHKYLQMAAGGVDPMPGTLVLVQEEIAILEALAEDHPGKADKLAALVAEWMRFRGRLMKALH